MNIESGIKDERRDIFSQVRTNILRTITNGMANMPKDTYDSLFKILVSTTKNGLHTKLVRLQHVHEPEAYMEVLKLLVLDDEELEILLDATYDQINIEF